MARVREIPFVVRNLGVWPFSKRVFNETIEDGVFNMAAAVAFYWLLALLPLIIFLLTLAPLMPTNIKDATQQRVTTWLDLNLAPQAAEPIKQNMESLLNEPRGGLLSIGLFATLWAASNGMNATMTALDRCYDITRPRHFLMQRLVAIVVTCVFAFGALLVILLIPVTTQAIEFLQRQGGEMLDYEWFKRSGALFIFLLDVARYTLGVMLVMFMVSTVYHFGGSVRRRWTFITPGAIFAVLGVMVLSYGFNWYIQSFGAQSYNQTYGTLGGVVILLLTLYLYAAVFLIGAEINSEIDYFIVHSKSAEGPDPLPRLHGREDLDWFRKKLEARQRREDLKRQ